MTADVAPAAVAPADADLRAAARKRRAAQRAKAELLAALPWLRTAVDGAPRRVPPPRPPRPAPGSVAEIAHLLPWLAGALGLPEGGPGSKAVSAGGVSAAPALGVPDHGSFTDLGVDEPETGGPSLPEGVPRPAIVAQRATPGLNAPKLYRYINSTDTPEEVTYGDDAALLGDMVALGARFFRQPAGVDLTVDGQSGTIPVVSDGDELYARLFQGSEQEQLLVSLFSRITPLADGVTPPEFDLKVVLTLFTLGHNDDSFLDNSGEYNTAVVSTGLPAGVVALTWDSAHADSPIRFWDGNPWTIDQYISAQDLTSTGTGYTYSSSVSEDVDWVYGTLDMRSPLKLLYLYYMGYALARMLLEVNNQLVNTHACAPIWSRILGIEVCNEVNKTNPFFNYDVGAHGPYGMLNTVEGANEASATVWAWGVRELVRGFQHKLADAVAAGAEGIEGLPARLPLWLPSMATYFAQGTTAAATGQPNFGNILLFQQYLCLKLVSVFDAANDERDCPEAPYRPDISWFLNQDYHFYHYREEQDAGPILRLVGELQAFRESFRSSRLFDAVGHPVTLSVCEIGSAADEDNIDVAAFRYMNPRSSSRPDVTQFQAREVWRRLAISAIRARYFAWHSHMSVVALPGGTTGFKYLGLREDAMAPATTDRFGNVIGTAAQDVGTRASWWAYQRLASLTSAGTSVGWPMDPVAIIARFVNPPTPASSGDFYHTLDQTSASAMLLAVHFQLAADQHAYLIMLDAATDTRELTAVSVTLATESGGDTDFEQWETVPSSITQMSRGATETAFPEDEPNASWNSPTLLGSGPTLVLKSVAVNQDPILIRTSLPLVIT